MIMIINTTGDSHLQMPAYIKPTLLPTAPCHWPDQRVYWPFSQPLPHKKITAGVN